jgi:hypothetical protein
LKTALQEEKKNRVPLRKKHRLKEILFGTVPVLVTCSEAALCYRNILSRGLLIQKRRLEEILLDVLLSPRAVT